MAQEETSNRGQCWSDKLLTLTARTASLLRQKGEEIRQSSASTLPSHLRNFSCTFPAGLPSQPSPYCCSPSGMGEHQKNAATAIKGAHDRNEGTPLIPGTGTKCSKKTHKVHMSRLHIQKGRSSQGLTTSPPSRNFPLKALPPHSSPDCHSPSKVGGPSIHCDSGLPWHASCISWHKRSGARWQLNATRASS